MPKTPATTERYAADFEAVQAGPAAEWLRDLRSRAFSRFRELGFPTARKGNEPWKYTNVAPIAKAEFALSPDHAGGAGFRLPSVAPADEAWTTAVFINGRYVRSAAAPISSLAQALTTDGSLVRRYLAQYADFENEAFTALNTAFLQDGAFIHVPEGESRERPIHIVFAASESAAPAVSYPRTLIVVGGHSKAVIIETYLSLGTSNHFTNAVTEVVVGDGAQVDHYRILLENHEAFHVGVTRVHQDRDSSFTSTAFDAGAALARQDLRVLLDAPGSETHLRGLYITTGTQHLDNFINIDHIKPHCTSRLYYKGILDDRSRAVFGGTVFVRPGADKTDAYQQDKNLLLSDQAEVDSKPSLEICADDVKCSHGATAGAVDEDALFYMRSRGLDEQTASLLLVKAFAGEILDTVRVPSLRSHLEQLTMLALPRFQGWRSV